MFCSNCGKQLENDVKFCDGCGVQQGTGNDINSASNQQAYDMNSNANYQSAPVLPNPPVKKTPKKKTNIFISLAIVLVAFLVGKFVIAPSMTSDSVGGNTGSQIILPENTSSTYSISSDTSNSIYDSILTDAYIVHFQPMFNMDSASYVLKQEDGKILCADYGYKEDVVRQWVETMYIPVSDYNDTQKTELEDIMKRQFTTVEALNCCTVTYKMSTNYFTITCTYSDVDKEENYSELYNAQILQANTFISMSATESTLFGQGFVKK